MRLTVTDEQGQVAAHHAATEPRPPRRYQRPIISRAHAERLIEVELIRSVMSAAPERF